MNQRRIVSPFVVLAVVLCFVGIARADERVLTLTAAQTEARAAAPEASALAARLRAAEIVLADSERRVRLDPSLALRYGGQVGSYDEHDVLAGLRWPVDMSGSRRFREKAARAEQDRAGLEREAGLRALDEVVAIAVADLAFAQRQLARAQRVYDLYRIGVEAETSRFGVGSGTQLDVDGAELDAIAADARVEQARVAVASRRARLARLLGRSTGRGLVVADPSEAIDTPADEVAVSPDANADARVRAADATVRARLATRAATGRAARPIPTFGIDVGWRRNDIPAGAFSGPSAAGLSALWREYEFGVSVGVPLPLFDRGREQRSRAHADIQLAEADRTTIRADVSSEAEQAAIEYRGAIEVHRKLATTSRLVERDLGLIERAMTTGTLDAVSRAVVLRRLELATVQLDAAVRDLRIARARWIRRTAVSGEP